MFSRRFVGSLLSLVVVATGALSAVSPWNEPVAADPAGGPRPTSIVHSGDGASTAVLVHGIGNASVEHARENRSMRHSDLQPVGRFVRSGDAVAVALPADSPTTTLAVGLTGTFAAFNGGRDVGVRVHQLTTGATTEIIADRDGMLFLQSIDTSGSSTATVRGGEPVPTFVSGQTTNDAFQDQLARWPDAPMVTVVGQRIFGDFQHRTRVAMPADMNARVAEWDRVVLLTNEHYGLLDDGVGLARKAAQRIYITSPDTGAGYANASSGRLMFPVSTAAAGDLFRLAPKDLWGLWHEVGHTYQTPTYNWSGLGEIAVNIAPLSIQGRSWGTNRLDAQGTAIESYFQKPIDQREFTSIDVWTRLFMFDQLRRAFGEAFYPRLNQELRVDLHTKAITTPDDASKQRAFALTASRVADRDLGPFFREWGISLPASVEEQMAELPPLRTAIWENRVYADTVRERELPSYAVPVGALRGSEGPVTVGQRAMVDPPSIVGLGDTGGGPARLVEHGLRADTPGTGTVSVVLANDDDVREVISGPIGVTTGHSFLFRGLSDRQIARLALDPQAHALRFIPITGYAAHGSWANREYIGFELRTADDSKRIANWSVAGHETAHPVAAGFDQTYEDGQLLIVRHQEPSSRLDRFADGEAVPRPTSAAQKFRILGDALVPYGASPVRGLTGPEATLVRGAERPVEVHLVVESPTSRLRGSMSVTAPSGTTLPADQTLRAESRAPGGTWVRAAALDLETAPNGPSALAASLDASDLDLAPGTMIRWAVSVSTPADIAGPGTPLTWSMEGTADARPVRTGA